MRNFEFDDGEVVFAEPLGIAGDSDPEHLHTGRVLCRNLRRLRPMPSVMPASFRNALHGGGMIPTDGELERASGAPQAAGQA